MNTVKELKQFYLRNKNQYSREKQNKINYLFKVIQSSFGDVGHVHEIEELLKQKPVGIFDMLSNFDDWRPLKNKYFASKL